MGDIIQTISKTVSNTPQETVRTRYYEQDNTQDLLSSEAIETEENSAENIVSLCSDKAITKQKYDIKKNRKSIAITAIALALICTISAVSLKNIARSKDTTTANTQFSSTEMAKSKTTHILDEQIRFEKSTYSVEIRKTVQLACEYSYTKEPVEEITAITTQKKANKNQSSSNDLKKATEKNTAKATEKATEKNTAKVAEKTTTKATEKITEKTTTKATEKITEKTTTKATEKITEKNTTKATEKATEKNKITEANDIRYISSNIDIATVDNNGKVKGVSTGTTSIMAISPSGTYTTTTVTVTAPKSYTIKDVPLIYQGDDYPSGCESVSATMLLKYYGFDISVNDFIDKYLKMDYFSYENGKMCGPDPYSAFIGSPYTDASLGCFPPVIENAINKYFKNKNYRAVDITGSSMESITNNYIANGQPVVIWATMWLQDPVPTYEWTVRGSADYSPYNNGDTYQWLGNEHCMLLIGYDEDYYYINDPLNNDSVAKYSRQEFDFRYKQMGKCALIIENTN